MVDISKYKGCEIMKVIVCLDESNGMLFNKRRQSQDVLVRQDIMNHLYGSKLWMNDYSLKQFKDEICPSIMADEDFLEKADVDDYCFVENLPLASYEQKISTLIIYGWNRRYPADFYFDIDLQNWEMTEEIEFIGNSHEKITKTTYIRKDNK